MAVPTVVSHGRFEERLPFSDEESAYQQAVGGLAELGELADSPVRLGQTRFFGDHFGWPKWLTQATSLEGLSSDALPSRVRLRDDVLILANIIDAGFADEVIRLFAAQQRLPDSTTTALALMAEPTLGATLMRVSRMLEAHNPHVVFDLALEDGLIRFIIGYRARFGKLEALMSTLGLIMVRQVVRTIAPNAILELTFEIRPEVAKLLPAEFCSADTGSVIPSDTNHTAITLPARWFHHANSIHDPALNPLIDAAYQQSVAAIRGLQTEADRVRAAIASSLSNSGTAPRLKQVSQELGIPVRTIVRRLNAEGTSFHDLVDGERQTRARAVLADPTISLKQAAAQLGFPDASSFGRAFRRWYGVSPGTFRKSLK